jgi:hypothetical protein
MDRTAIPAVLPRLAAGLAVAAVVAACSVTWVGVVLADVYRPRAAEAAFGDVIPGGRRSTTWSDWHGRATVALLVVTVGTAAAAAWLRDRTRGLPAARRRAVLVGSVAAVAAALVTWATRAPVQWDQLALRSVTTGIDVTGYWPAAFDGDVRHVLVGSGEVSQGRYAATLLVHLGAPVVGAVASLLAVWGLLPAVRTTTPDPDGR